MQLRISQNKRHCNLINKLNCIDLLLVLLQISARVCVLLDYIVFRTLLLEKLSLRRPQRGTGLPAVGHVLPPPVGGAHFYIVSILPRPIQRLLGALGSWGVEGNGFILCLKPS